MSPPADVPIQILCDVGLYGVPHRVVVFTSRCCEDAPIQRSIRDVFQWEPEATEEPDDILQAVLLQVQSKLCKRNHTMKLENVPIQMPVNAIPMTRLENAHIQMQC